MKIFADDKIPCLGTGLVILTSTESSDSSYYGEQSLHYITTNGITCVVPLGECLLLYFHERCKIQASGIWILFSLINFGILLEGYLYSFISFLEDLFPPPPKLIEFWVFHIMCLFFIDFCFQCQNQKLGSNKLLNYVP